VSPKSLGNVSDDTIGITQHKRRGKWKASGGNPDQTRVTESRSTQTNAWMAVTAISDGAGDDQGRGVGQSPKANVERVYFERVDGSIRNGNT
jgi:hypothetical protein